MFRNVKPQPSRKGWIFLFPEWPFFSSMCLQHVCLLTPSKHPSSASGSVCCYFRCLRFSPLLPVTLKNFPAFYLFNWQRKQTGSTPLHCIKRSRAKTNVRMRAGAERHLFIHTERLLKVSEATCALKEELPSCLYSPSTSHASEFPLPSRRYPKTLTVKHRIYHTCVQFGRKVWARWCSPVPCPKHQLPTPDVNQG